MSSGTRDELNKDLELGTYDLLRAGVPIALLPTPINVDGAVVREDAAGNVAFQRLTLDDIDPAFVISAFSPAFTTTVELGATIANPAFTAAYNATLIAPLTINDGTNTDAIALGSQASFGYNNGGGSGLPARSYSKTAVNATQVWTLSAEKSPTGPTKTAAVVAAWRARRYFDIVTDPGSYNSAWANGLAQSGLASGFAGAYAFGAGSARYVFMVWPTAFGSPSSFKDQNGFVFPMSRVATGVNVTNANGVVTAYDVWRSDNPITSAFTITVS